MTMSLIQTVTVGSGGAASIEFTSIPQDGTDLLLLVSGRAATDASSQTRITVGGNTSSNYNTKELYGTGSSAVSFERVSQTAFVLTQFVNDFDYTANTFANSSAYFSNYAGSTNKSASFDYSGETNATTVRNYLIAGSLAATTAITSIAMTLAAGNFAQHTVASLYKITKGSDGTTVVS